MSRLGNAVQLRPYDEVCWRGSISGLIWCFARPKLRCISREWNDVVGYTSASIATISPVLRSICGW